MYELYSGENWIFIYLLSHACKAQGVIQNRFIVMFSKLVWIKTVLLLFVTCVFF